MARANKTKDNIADKQTVRYTHTHTHTHIVHSFTPFKDVLADIVPVDMVSNFTLAVPWFIAQKAPQPRDTRDVRVFNITSGSINSCTWEVWEQRIVESYRKYPLENRIFRRPHFYLVDKNSWYYFFRRGLFHLFPAHTADLLFRLLGQPPKMIKAMEKMDRACTELQYVID